MIAAAAVAFLAVLCFGCALAQLFARECPPRLAPTPERTPLAPALGGVRTPVDRIARATRGVPRYR